MAANQDKSVGGGLDRRGFIRAVARWGIEQVEQVGKAAGESIGAATRGTPATGAGDLAKRYLRPPGALSEPELGQSCSGCGACVAACPAECIRLDAAATDPVAAGLPYIVARLTPCVVCDGLSCMHACPTGALRLVDRAQIRMGIAVVDHATCLRRGTKDKSPDPTGLPTGEPTDSRLGEDCRMCIEDCPFGETAIGLSGDDQIQIRDGCVGCGVCERVCPTDQPSIVIHSGRDIPTAL